MNTPPLYGPSATRALTFIPNTSLYQRADASGSTTYSTTCATRLILGMLIVIRFASGRPRRQPRDVGDLAELAPLLAPAVAAIDAAEQVAVLGARENEVRIGLMRAQ